jgi:hypothetical protein
VAAAPGETAIESGHYGILQGRFVIQLTLASKYHRRARDRQGFVELLLLRGCLDLYELSPGGRIRIFGVSLLAVAALAAAGLLWKRRREELLARISLPRERDLEELRQAGF